MKEIKKKPRIIALASIKGGTGKSTNTVLLARHLAESGSRVLVIDLDPQASTTDYFLRDEPAASIASACTYHLLTERAELSEVLRPAGLLLDMVPAAPILSTADLELATDPAALLNFRGAISGGDHDYILIDTPPTLSAANRAALYAADLVLVPVQPDRWVLQGLAMLAAAARKATKATGRACPVMCVPSICSEKDADTVRATLTGYTISTSYIPRSVSVRRAMTRAAAPGKAILLAVESLAAEIGGQE